MHVRTVETTEDFASLRDDWHGLLARSRQENPYLSHEWLMASWEAYAGAEDRLNILCCYRDETDALVGILPICSRPESGLLPSRRLGYFGHLPVGPGCIADPQAAEAVFDEIAAHLHSACNQWDVLSLQNVDSSSAFLARILAQFGRSGRPVVRETLVSPPIELAATWETFLGSVSHHQRSQVRRRRSRLESLGTVELEYVMAAKDLPGALRDAARMFEHSMRRKYGRPFEVSDRYDRLMASMSERFLALGWLRLLFLKVDGERVAFVYQLRHGSTMFAFKFGFDSAWTEQAVGMVALSYAIEGAIVEGCRSYVLGGYGNLQARWGATGVRSVCDLTLYGRSAIASVIATRDATALRMMRSLKPLVPASVRARRALVISWRELQDETYLE
jgi:CelD/BcsL family acetyltransferase involved in cellulose biosynthesis